MTKLAKSALVILLSLTLIIGTALNASAFSILRVDQTAKTIAGLDNAWTEEELLRICLVEFGCRAVSIDKAGAVYGTGTRINIHDYSGMTTYTIVYYGDINGDCQINRSDVIALTSESMELTHWSVRGHVDYVGFLTEAGDLNNDGRITSTDVNLLNDVVRDYAKIDQFTGQVIHTDSCEGKTDEDITEDLSTNAVLHMLAGIFAILELIMHILNAQYGE